MKIHGVKLENFMLFDKLDAKFSPNVNIICGENSTGKTTLIKLLYACATTCLEVAKAKEYERKLEIEERDKGFILIKDADCDWCRNRLFPKLYNVFSLREDNVISLSNRFTNSLAQVSLDFRDIEPLRFALRHYTIAIQKILANNRR